MKIRILIVFVVYFILPLSMSIDKCPTVPKGCLCTHKKKSAGFKILCEGLSHASLAYLPNNISFDIDLKSNSLLHINKSMFPHPNKIKKLILRDNRIAVIGEGTFDGFDSLKRLDLSENFLTRITEKTFSGLISANLTSLELQMNRILYISQRSFSGLNIGKLDMSHQLNDNSMKAELTGYIDFLSSSKVTEISLDGNQLLCDCNIRWLGNWMKQDGKKVSELTSCYYPEELRGVLLQDLFKSNWNCRQIQNNFRLPRFNLSPTSNQFVFINDSIKLSCQSTFLQMSYLRWFKDGVEIPPSTHQRFQIKNFINWTLATYKSVLFMDRLEKQDTGLVSCQVHGAGNASLSIELIVFSDNKLQCQPNETVTDRGSIMWPTTAFGMKVSNRCPYGGRGLAWRECRNGSWGPPMVQGCYFGNPITRTLQSFYHSSQSKDINIVVATGNTLSRFFHEKYKFVRSKFDFYFLYKTLYEIMMSYVDLDPEHYTGFFWGIVGLVAQKYGHLAELYMPVYGRPLNLRFVHLLESYLVQEVPKKPDMFSVDHHRSLAAFSMRIQSKSTLHCYLTCASERFKVQCSKFRNATAEELSATSFQYFVGTASSVDARLSVIAYRTSTFFPYASLNRAIIGTVFGVQITNVTFEEGAEYTLLSFRSTTPLLQPELLFWDNEKSGWMPLEHCTLLQPSQSNLVQYKCYLESLSEMFYYGLSIVKPARVKYTVTYMETSVYIGSALNTVLLAVTLLLYVTFRQLRYNRSDAATLMNLCLALIIAQLSFSCGIHRVNTHLLCKGIAFSLHYFLLCALLWLGCGGVILVRMLKRKHRRKKWKYDPVLKYYLISWGLPLLICSITIAYDQGEYSTLQYCWLSPKIAPTAFVCPASIFLFFDLVIFCYLHALINRVYPESLDDESVPAQSINKSRKDMESFFPLRNELLCILRGSLSVLLLFSLLFTFTLMMYVYKGTTSGYLYYVFCYASAICNIMLALAVLYFHCLQKPDIVWTVKNAIMHCLRKSESVVGDELLARESSTNIEEKVDTPEESVAMETHGVFGLSDQPQLLRQPAVLAVIHEPSSCDVESDCNGGLLLSKVTASEMSEVEKSSTGGCHNSIGECSLVSHKRTRKVRPKNPDIPDNLKPFVPENWRPVRRKARNGASFYPYLNTNISAKTSYPYTSNPSSVTSGNVPLSINKKQAAKNLAMYNELFSQVTPVNVESIAPSSNSSFVQRQLPPVFFPAQQHSIPSNDNLLNRAEDSTLLHAPLLVPSDAESNKRSSINNNAMVTPKDPPCAEIKTTPILYIPLPHVTKKQFEVRAETRC